MIQELLLGDNPFIGVSHLSQEKARAEVREALLENRARVVEAAVKGGATGFTFSTHENNLELLTYLNINNSEVFNKLNYYILVPYAQLYVRKANIEGTPALLSSVLSEIAHTGKSSIIDAVAALTTLNPARLAELFIEIELSPYLKILPKKNVKAILLHEILTDLLLAHDLFDVVASVGKRIKKRIGTGFGVETRNFGCMFNFLLTSNCYPEYVMTPINRLGYQMAPKRETVEKNIKDLTGKSKVIAINIMASGALSMEETIQYLAKYKENLYAVTCASSKPERALSNFKKLSQAFLQTELKTVIVE